MAREMKIGDKVLAVGESSRSKPPVFGVPMTSRVVAGREYTINDIAFCPKCGVKFLEIREDIEYSAEGIVCADCGGICGTKKMYYARAFILPDLESLEHHRAEVSAKELLTIKKIQHT